MLTVFNRSTPRFQGENFDKNIKLVHKFEELAKRKNATSGQLCLAWLMSQGGKVWQFRQSLPVLTEPFFR